MAKSHIITLLLTLLILSGLVHKFMLITKLPAQIDELCALSRTCNHSIDTLASSRSLDSKKIYTLGQVMEVFTTKMKPTNFIQDSIYYLQNFHQLTDHPPIADIASKLIIINNKVGILNLRYLALFYWLLSLWVIWLVFKELSIPSRTSLLALVLYSGFTLGSLTASFGKAYSLQILSCFLALLLYIQSSRQGWKTLLSLSTFHVAFLIHYFSVLILLPWFIFIDLAQKRFFQQFKSLLYGASLLIYLPIIMTQRSHTRDYFTGHHSVFKEFKILIKRCISLYDLNFYGLAGLLIIGLFLWLLIKSEKRKNILIYFFISSLPLIALSLYDLLMNDYMLKTLRYSLISLPFVALVWALLIEKKRFNTILILSLLLLNIWVPKLVDKKKLNSGINKDPDNYISNIHSNDFNNKSLFLVANYHARNLIVLHAVESKLLGISPIEGFVQEDLINIPQNNNIFVATLDYFQGQAVLDDFIKTNQIKNIYTLPFKGKSNIYQKLNFSKYNHKMLNIEV